MLTYFGVHAPKKVTPPPSHAISSSSSTLWGYIPNFFGSSSFLQPETLKKFTNEITSSPLSLKEVWQTHFSRKGISDGHSEFVSKMNSDRNAAQMNVSVQKNYPIQPKTTWQISILGELDLWFSSINDYSRFNGDYYFPALSSGSGGMIRASQDGCKDPVYFALDEFGGYWTISAQNSSRDVQTFICFDATTSKFSFSTWNLNADSPVKMFSKDGYENLTASVNEMEVIGCDSQTNHLEAWDLDKRQLKWRLADWRHESSGGYRIQFGPFHASKQLLLSYCGNNLYCFDLKNPKLLWKTQFNQTIDGSGFIGEDKIIIPSINIISVIKQENGSMIHHFELGQATENNFPYVYFEKTLAALDKNNNKKPILYDIDKGVILRECQEAPFTVDKFYASGNFLVGIQLDSSRDSTVQFAVWDTTTGSLYWTNAFDSKNKYIFLDVSGRYLSFLKLDIKDDRPVEKEQVVIKRSAVPIIPVSTLPILVWDIKHKTAAGMITENFTDISTNGPMLISFASGTLRCMWPSQSQGTQMLIKDYAWKINKL